MESNTVIEIKVQDVEKGETETLVSGRNPTPTETVYLSNIDQTVAFPVETIFFFEASSPRETVDIFERVKKSVSEVLLSSAYYFMAGRLSLNPQTKRLELLCNNTGVLFAAAMSRLQLKDLGDVSLPNPSFHHLIIRTDGFKTLSETPIFTIQITRFKCGGFSVGFVTNHSILDGRSALEMFENLASICRGEGMRRSPDVNYLCNDRTCIRARNPPRIQYEHTEYTKLTTITDNNNNNNALNLSSSSFTSPNHPPSPSSLLKLSDSHRYRVFSFSADMVKSLKDKAATTTYCSTFEVVVAHLWRARTKAVFDQDPCGTSSVLFAVDFRSKISPPLPVGFVGNAVITASASATVADLDEKPFSFCVGMVKAAIDRVTNDEYVRSVIDWLEVHKGVPSTLNGNFFVSAWWKLPFYDLDFGYGKPLYGGPIVSGMDEFVLLLSDNGGKGKDRREGQKGGRGGGGINVWVVLEKEKMDKFMHHVLKM